MKSALTSTASRKTSNRQQTPSKPPNNYGKPKIEQFKAEYVIDNLPSSKRKTRRGRSAANADNFSINISRRNIPTSSRVLRSATRIQRNSLTESQSFPHQHLPAHHDPTTDPLHFEIAEDTSSNTQLLIDRFGSEDGSIYINFLEDCQIRTDRDFNELTVENSNLISQPNNSVTDASIDDGEQIALSDENNQRGSVNELMLDPNQLTSDNTLISNEVSNHNDNLASLSIAIDNVNQETPLLTDTTQDHGLDGRDGSTAYEDYRWLLDSDSNGVIPVPPDVSSEDIAALLINTDLDESVPLSEIRPTMFQDLTDSLMHHTSGMCIQNLESVAQPAISEPSRVSTSACSLPLNVNTDCPNFGRFPTFGAQILGSESLPHFGTSGGTIEHVHSPVTTNQSSVLNNNPRSPHINEELDLVSPCRIHLVDTPPSFTRIPEPNVTSIRHQLPERQNSVQLGEPQRRTLQVQQTQTLASRSQLTSGATANERQNLVYLEEPQMRNIRDRQQPFAVPPVTSGAQVNDGRNSVHSERHRMRTFQDRQQLPFGGQQLTSDAQAIDGQNSVYSGERRMRTFQDQQQPFAVPPVTSGAQASDGRQNSVRSEEHRQHQPVAGRQLTITAQANERQNSVRLEEPRMRTLQQRQHKPIAGRRLTSATQANGRQSSVRSEEHRQHQPVAGRQLTIAAQANERQNSVRSEEPRMRTLQHRQHQPFAGHQLTSGVNDGQISVYSEEPRMRTFHHREQPSVGPPVTSGAQANDGLNSVHMGEPRMRTLQDRQQQPSTGLQVASAAQANERQNVTNLLPYQANTNQNCQSYRRPPVSGATTYTSQANERQNSVRPELRDGQIYPRPFAGILPAGVTSFKSEVLERQNWHHSYQPQYETYENWQGNPSSLTTSPLPVVTEVRQNLLPSEQYNRRTTPWYSSSVRAHTQMDDWLRNNSQYRSSTVDAASNQYLRTHPLRGANHENNIPFFSRERNEIYNMDQMMGMHAEHRQNIISSILPPDSLQSNFVNSQEGNTDNMLSDERTRLDSGNDSVVNLLNALSNEYYY